MDSPQILYDVALSFAGSDRAYVEAVAVDLRGRGLRVFYDQDQQVDLWGEELTEKLDAVYRQQARFVVIFVSRAYADRVWTRHERRSALARAVVERGPYILPARFDDTELDGLRPTIGFLDLRALSPGELAESIERKIRGNGEAAVAEREEPWEILLFVRELRKGWTSLAPQLNDFWSGYAAPTGVHLVSFDDVSQFVDRRLGEASSWSSNFSRLMSRDNQQRAFGAPGEDGDEHALRYLTDRMTRLMAGFADWALGIRGAHAPEDARPVLWALSRYAEDPLFRYHHFIDACDRQVQERIQQVESGQVSDPVLRFELSFGIPAHIGDEFERAWDAYTRWHPRR